MASLRTQPHNLEAEQALPCPVEAHEAQVGRVLHEHHVGQVLDDLVQEVMLAVHHKRATWDSSRPFLPWLAAIARYRWVDHLRKVYRTEEDALEDYDAPHDSEEDAVIARLSLERMFVQIPDKQSEAIELVKIEGLSIAEAAARSGQSESAVKVNIHRGLKKLAALVEKAE